jgi:hypothetical protein
MSPVTEGQHAGEFILHEPSPGISRENVTVTVPASTTLAPGMVLGQLSASGKYVPYDDDETDGRETAVAILFGELKNDQGSPQDMAGVAVARLAAVRKSDLQWASSVESAEKTAAYTDLASVFIIARD